MTTATTVAAPAAPPRVSRDVALKLGLRYAPGLLGVLLLVCLWWVAGAFKWFKGTVPTPWTVLGALGDLGDTFYSTHLTATITSASKGFVYGNVLAIAIAVAVVLVPVLEGVATQLAIISYCTPIIAIAPIVQVAFKGIDSTPTVVFIAAILVFFTTMVGTLTGLRSAHRASLDVVQVYGGGRISKLLRVQLISALPAILASLKIAAPAAMLGAVLGEFLSGPPKGVGMQIILRQGEGNITQVWAMCALATLVAGLAYAVLWVIELLVTRFVTGKGLVG